MVWGQCPCPSEFKSRAEILFIFIDDLSVTISAYFQNGLRQKVELKPSLKLFVNFFHVGLCRLYIRHHYRLENYKEPFDPNWLVRLPYVHLTLDKPLFYFPLSQFRVPACLRMFCGLNTYQVTFVKNSWHWIAYHYSPYRSKKPKQLGLQLGAGQYSGNGRDAHHHSLPSVAAEETASSTHSIWRYVVKIIN